MNKIRNRKNNKGFSLVELRVIGQNVLMANPIL